MDKDFNFVSTDVENLNQMITIVDFWPRRFGKHIAYWFFVSRILLHDLERLFKLDTYLKRKSVCNRYLFTIIIKLLSNENSNLNYFNFNWYSLYFVKKCLFFTYNSLIGIRDCDILIVCRVFVWEVSEDATHVIKHI